MRNTVSEKLEAAVELVNRGVNPTLVATSLGLNPRDIKTMHAQSVSVRTTLSPEDQQLAEQMRALVKAAIDEAWVTLEFGRPDDKQALIRMLLTRSMGLVGMETTQRMDEMRGEFEKLLESQKEGGESAAKAIAATVSVDDPDEGSDDGEVRSDW